MNNNKRKKGIRERRQFLPNAIIHSPGTAAPTLHANAFFNAKQKKNEKLSFSLYFILKKKTQQVITSFFFAMKKGKYIICNFPFVEKKRKILIK